MLYEQEQGCILQKKTSMLQGSFLTSLSPPLAPLEVCKDKWPF